MEKRTHRPKALFLSADGTLYPDTLICSGSKPCPYARDGGMPDPTPLDPNGPAYSVDKGQPGDLCPPCAKQQLSSLAHWQGHGGQHFAAALLPLRLFKCRRWFWLVVPGLEDAAPTVLRTVGSGTWEGIR